MSSIYLTIIVFIPLIIIFLMDPSWSSLKFAVQIIGIYGMGSLLYYGRERRKVG
tara:strand:- start:261 stop:422 length:162 start_codon:yes stop_codon:yes gene_type:complete